MVPAPRRCQQDRMCDLTEEEAEAVRCLLSYSDSCYLGLLDGPPQNGAVAPTVSRWENIRPSAEYDLTDRRLNSIRKRKRRPSNHFLGRGAISLPNIRPQKRFAESYMSGHLDENYSYVYTGGLSERAYSAEHGHHQKMHHVVDPLLHVQQPGGHSYSTHTLTLDTGSVFASRHAVQMDMKMRREISRLVAMQLKPEILAEQIAIENRLRNLELNAFPVLGARNENAIQTERRHDGTSTILATKSNSAPPMEVMRWGSHAHRKKNRRKTKLKANSFEWCPMGIQEYSSTDFRLPTKSAIDSPNTKHQVTVNNSPTLAPTSLRNHETGLSSILGVGALSRKRMTHIKSPKNDEKSWSNDDKERLVISKRSLAYFGQERFAVKSSVPSMSDLNGEQLGPYRIRELEGDHEQPGPYRIRVPVVVPTLKQEPAPRTKRFNGRLTTLHPSGTV